MLSLAAVALLASACGSDNTSTSDEGGVTRIEITVSHHPTTMFSVPYLVAMDQRFFAEEGIEITGISGSEGGGTTVRNVLTGDLAFGEVAPPAAAQAYAAGSPVVAVGGGVQSVADQLYVTTKDSPVTGIQDLVGKKVAYTNPGSVTQGILTLSLEAAGIDPATVQSSALGGIGEGLTALEGGGVAAAASIEPVFSDNPGPYKVLWRGNQYIPEFQQSIIITGPEMVEENPELIRSFLRARARATEWIAKNPQRGAELWAAAADLEPRVATAALQTVLQDEYYGVGFHQRGLAAVDHEMRLIGLVEQDAELSWGELINQDFLPPNTQKIDPTAIASR